MTISTRAYDVRGRSPQGMIGSIVEGNYLNDAKTLINADPQAGQTSTLVVATATNSHVYSVTINGIAVTYTADGSATKAEIADGLTLAINAEIAVRGQVSATSDGIDTITLITANGWPESFTVTSVDALLTYALVSAAAAAAAIPFGRLVISGDYELDEANELGILAASTKLAAKVDTITVDYAASEVYYIDITIGGRTYHAEADADTDDATTATAIRTAINAAMPAATVIATGATDQVILTAEVLGTPFSTSVSLKSETAARLALVNTTATDSTDLNRVAVGVSTYTTDEENLTLAGDDVSWRANAGVVVLRKGLIWVACSESVAKGDPVYVELAVGADSGKFFKASSATRVLLTNAKWERPSRSTSGDAIAVLSVAFN